MDKIYPIVSHKGFVVMQNVETENAVSPVTQRWMQQNSRDDQLRTVLNANQLTSLSAMITYIAAMSGQSQYRVERNLSDRFNIPNAKCLSSHDYDKAIMYLADILPA